MGLLDDTKAWLAAGYQEQVERNRGAAPLGLIAALIVSESGKWAGGDFAVSIDKHLGESGRSQAPVYRLHAAGIDPFHAEAGIWFRCRDFLWDADWLRGRRAQCPQCGAVLTSDVGRSDWTCDNAKCKHGFASGWPSLFGAGGRDLWFCVILRYSIGKGALKHAMEETRERIASKRASGKPVGTFVAEMGEWARVTDLDSRQHRSYWGRQSGAKIRERIMGAKHLRRLDVAEAIGPLDGPPGGECAQVAPERFPPFPPELVPVARVMKAAASSDAQLTVAWKALKAYARKRLRESRKPKPSLIFRARRWAEVRFRGPRPDDSVA